MNTKTTITDVAQHAGVSIATVSRLINEAGPVSLAAEEKIRKAISELGYLPKKKRPAPSTPSAPPKPLALLRVGAFDSLSRSPLTEHLVEALYRHTMAVGRTLSVHWVPDLAACDVPSLVGNAEGVILRTSNVQDVNRAIVDKLNGLPAVQVLGETFNGRHWADLITPDNGQAGAMAAEYLIENGCDRLLFATSSLAGQVLRKRSDAFLRTARAAGKEAHLFLGTPSARTPQWLEELCGSSVHFHRAKDRPDLIRQLAAFPHRPFGLFVPADLELSLLLPQLQLAGMDVARDIRAIGCNRETRCFSGLDPMPATLDPHIDNIASRTVRRLLHRIQHPGEPLVRITVSPSLVRPADLLAECSAHERADTHPEALASAEDLDI